MAKKIDTSTLAVGAVVVAVAAAVVLPKLAQAGGSGDSKSGTPGITEGVYSGPRTYTVDSNGNAGVGGGGKGPKITGDDIEQGIGIGKQIWNAFCPNGCKGKGKDVTNTDEDGRI